MDPLSILAGTTGLLDVSFRVISYLKDLEESAGKVEDEIAALSQEISALITVNDAIEALWLANHDTAPGSPFQDTTDVEDLWKRLAGLLRDCRDTAQKLEALLKEVMGKKGPKVSGKWDGIRKQLRKDSKEKEWTDVRHRLSSYQAGLQMLLSALSVVYTRNSSSSTQHVAGSLDRIQRQSSTLQYQMEFLRHKLNALNSSDSDKLRNSINSAQAVASLLSLNQCFDIPQTVSSIFTGRDLLLKELKHMLDVATPQHQSHSQKRFVIYGLGGSGKTQFCCKFAQDNREYFWGVFWIDGSSYENARHTFSKIATMGGADPNENAAKSWLSSQQQPWLLLIDNADDPDIDVTRYFPGGERGVILMTTRNPSNKVHGTVGSRFWHFEKLETDEASDLLLKAADLPGPWELQTRTSAARIADALGYLPLALIHAGKAIMDGLCSLANYLDFYGRTWKRIRRARSMSGYVGDENANMNVYSTWEIVYLGLEAKKTETSKDGVELLKTFSFFYWEDIGVDILIAAAKNGRREQETTKPNEDKTKTPSPQQVSKKPWSLYFREIIIDWVENLQKVRPILPDVLRDDDQTSFDEDRLRTALTFLVQMGMLTYHSDSDTYWMHPLVHTWVRERPQTSTGEQAIWCQAAATTLTSCIFFKPPLEYATSDERLKISIFPHIENLRRAQNTIRERIQENQKTRRRSWLSSWIAPPVISSGMQPLEWVKYSLVYMQAGKWDEAEKLQLPVKELACQRLGLDHPRSIDIIQLLSVTYGLQARNNKAAILLRQALDACQRLYGHDHPRTLKMTDILGATCLLQSRLSESRTLHEHAVKGMTEVLGAEHEDTLIAVDNLGKVMSRYFFWDKARDLHLRAFHGMRKTLGSTHLHTLQAMEHVALSHMYLGDLDLAQEFAQEVLEKREKKVGKEHPYTLMAKLTVARVKSAQNETEEAERIIRTNLPVGERNLGDNHLGILLARVFLSEVLFRQQKYSEAEQILLSVVQRHRYEGSRREDGEHVDRIQALWFLLKCYQAQNKIEDAIKIGDELYESVHTIGGEGFGRGHVFAKLLDQKREELQALKSGSDPAPVPYDPISPNSQSAETIRSSSPVPVTKSLTF
ncbi:tetratricopeptide repeat domain-containing protein [Mollisia scopiformis]|uniref:Tetratricopeptide repeat domain-containing protein n=1 Tax=Mollisia scopiformis TaxID=149040 RepID=A0A194X1J2_MOLSC|nr:tetratricopeptide repeat domain-containing protein [Mollisia scopiformis]KUJ13717.1 tetratricopeptide repeat domain-containing protein [Mollisia scopiformis]